jgi:hypothetical protein
MKGHSFSFSTNSVSMWPAMRPPLSVDPGVIMKYRSLSLIVGALTALVSVAPAQAVTYTYAANMNAAAEGPSVVSSGLGFAVVTFDDAALTVLLTENWAFLTAPVSANHIHCCTAAPGTGSSSVVLPFTGVPASTSGFYTNTFTMTQTAFSSLLAGAAAGEAYVNLHTSAYPGGEIRGFLQGPALPVPEPAALVLMLAGAAAVVSVARKCKQA